MLILIINVSSDHLDKITYSEMLYGGFLLVYALYNLYFTSLLFPIIGDNQFVRLTIASVLLLFHCICYFPDLVDASNDLQDYAKEYDKRQDSDDDSYYYWYYSDDSDWGSYYRSEASTYATAASGLVIIMFACLMIISINGYVFYSFNPNSGEKVNNIAQLSSLLLKRAYLITIIILVIGLIIYLIGLGLIMQIIYLWFYQLITFYAGMYILFSAIVVIIDIALTYKCVN